MRVLLLTPLFQPEPNHLKGLAFARELVRRGHDVEVLTGFPHYPAGKVYPGYRIRPWMREILDGVPVTRVMMYPSHDRSAVRRTAGYLSLAGTAALLGPPLVARPDVVHVYQGPATLAWPAMVFRMMFGTPYVLDVQDMWPESVTVTGMLPLPGVSAVLGAWSKATYRLARKIIVLSNGYKKCLEARGVPEKKIEVVYNWCDERSLPGETDGEGSDPFGLAGRFNVVYSGNFGALQALGGVLDAAFLIEEKRPDIRFVFVGDGVEESALKKKAAGRGQKNVLFIPRQAPESLGRITARADVLLVHLKDDPLARMGIPQKTQASLAAGKPVLLAIRGSAAELAARAGGAWTCRPEDPAALAEAVLGLASLSWNERETMGRRNAEFYRKELAFSIGVGRMTAVFEEAAVRPRRKEGGR